MIVKKSKGGGLAINPNHIFADSTARDAYFVAHPTELVKGTFISVGTDYEEYDGGGYQNKTAILQGDPGLAGSIQVGTVTTLSAGSNATVVNVGTTNSAIFDFGIPKGADGSGGGSATWGGITGTLSAQTDLNSALNGKQATLVSGTNIKTINGTSILGSGNMVISGGTGAVDSVNTKTGTVTLNQDEIPDGTTYKQYSATEKTKLSGIATGAQVNTSKVKASATDTTEGYLGDKIVAGANVTVTKNNSGGNETYTIASTGGSSAPIYSFYQVDSGSTDFICEPDENGGLLVGGAGSNGWNENRALATCAEMIGKNKYIAFSVRDVTFNPALLINCNGSYTAKTTAFRGFGVTIGAGVVTLNKYVGSDITAVKTTYAVPTTNGVNVVVKIAGKRIEVVVYEKLKNTIVYSDFIQDADVQLFGDINGFTNGWQDYSCFSEIEIADLSLTGKYNIVFGGDSQFSDNATPTGTNIPYKFSRLAKLDNVFVKNTSVSGRVITDLTTNFATEVVPLKNAECENIYAIYVGTNDILWGTPATMVANLETLITTAKTAGFKVLVSTITIAGNTSANITNYNVAIRQMKVDNEIDYLYDIYAGDVIDGALGYIKANLTLPDGLHFTVHAKDIIAEEIYTLLSPLFSQIATDEKTGIGETLALTKNYVTKIALIDQTYTYAEKTKLANAIAGTFTTNDGKTITVVGGMITSIV